MNATTKGRLLVVDDEAPLLKALCQTLEEEGYVVAGAASAEDALNKIREFVPELVLTDLMMPKVNGITFLQEALVLDPTLVGVVMTGHGSVETAVEAMKKGAVDYVLKPVKLKTLLPVLDRALDLRRLRVKNTVLEKRIRERTQELELANEELEAFTSSISHDLRTPLRAVTGIADILLASDNPGMSADVRRYVGLIRTGTEEMGTLITHLLAFSKIGRQPLARQVVELGRTFSEAYETLSGERAGRVIDFKLHPLPSVQGDPTLLRVVAMNLLSNAIKYTRHKSVASIEVGITPPTIDIVPTYFVKDNGVGFDMENAAKLFTVFQRLHHAHEFEGTGVGLATVRRIVERHGGTITAEAELGEGATFRFTLGSENA